MRISARSRQCIALLHMRDDSIFEQLTDGHHITKRPDGGCLKQRSKTLSGVVTGLQQAQDGSAMYEACAESEEFTTGVPYISLL